MTYAPARVVQGNDMGQPAMGGGVWGSCQEELGGMRPKVTLGVTKGRRFTFEKIVPKGQGMLLKSEKGRHTRSR